MILIIRGLSTIILHLSRSDWDGDIIPPSSNNIPVNKYCERNAVDETKRL